MFFQEGKLSARKSLKNQTGLTLVETVISMVVIAIIVVVGLDAPVLLKRNFTGQKREFTSLNIINSQIEDLREKAMRTPAGFGHTDLSAGTHSETANITPDIPNGAAGATLSYVVVVGGWTDDGDANDTDFKTITVTYTYPPTSNEQPVVITGYVVE